MRILHVCARPERDGEDARPDLPFGLARASAREGHDVRIVVPAPGGATGETELDVELGDALELAHVSERATGRPALPIYQLSGEPLARALDVPPDDAGTSIRTASDGRAAAFFCAAVGAWLRELEWRPDLIHCHGHATGLVPAYLRLRHYDDAELARTPVIASYETLDDAGSYGGLVEVCGVADELSAGVGTALTDPLSLTWVGCQFADYLTTWSRAYAARLLAEADGSRLHLGVVLERRGDFAGVRPGIDVDRWNPERSDGLAAAYGAGELGGKAEAKQALQAELGWPVDSRRALLAIPMPEEPADRDRLLDAAPELARSGAQLVLSAPDPAGESARRAADTLASESDRIRVLPGDDVPSLHRIYAAADLYLSPWAGAPCDTSHLRAMRFGAVPIVLPRDARADAVLPPSSDPELSTGFHCESDAASWSAALQTALRLRKQSKPWRSLVERTMAEDWSWDRSARRHGPVYRKVLTRTGRA